MSRSAKPTEPDHRHAALLYLGALGAGFFAVLGILGPMSGSIWNLPDQLKAHAEEALIESGHPGVGVEIDGQRAILHGVVPDAETARRLYYVVKGAAGAGGAWAGGITDVDFSALKIGEFTAPFAWRVRRDGQQLVLSGAVQSEYARRELLRVAKSTFQNANDPVDNMEIVGGAPSPDWLDVAKDAIRQLATIGAGEARLIDNRLVIIGSGDAEEADALRGHYETMRRPYEARIDVAVAGEDGALDALAAGGGAEACDAAFASVMDNNVINFATGSAAIDGSSQALLDRLASVALRCDRFTIEVAGHTDNQGGRAVNMALSQARAEAVLNYLRGQGVAADRMNAVGYGPDNPVASNATTEGQAANRRIEFSVST